VSCNPSSAAQQAQFHTTHWSVVLRAKGGKSSEAGVALEILCQTYWYPLYAFVRRRGHTEHDAEDVVQGFLAHLLKRSFLEGVAREKGRFRSFLLSSLENYMADERDKQRAKKRGGRQVVCLDDQEPALRYALESVDALAPDKLFERAWAFTLLKQAQRRIEAEYVAEGKEALYEQLRDFNSFSGGSPTYGKVANALGLPLNTLKSLVHRMRQRYRQLLREEIAKTVSTAAEVDDEIRHLLRIFSD
jgi:RNA polymerase sigma factor (sigma-70 family)